MKPEFEDDDLDWMEDESKPRIIRKIVVAKRKKQKEPAATKVSERVIASPEREAQREVQVDAKRALSSTADALAKDARKRGCVDQASTEKIEKKKSALTMYSDELQRIGALRATGLDAQVRLPFVKLHVAMSRAKIYRAIKACKFPKQIKHGRCSFWRFSEIEHVRVHGVWPATCTESPSASGD